MPDLYDRRFGVRGQKKDIADFMEYMAKRAAQRDSMSWFFEMILRENLTESSYEGEYGLTKGFDEKKDEDIVKFISSGGMIRRFASEIPYEEFFKDIAERFPNLEMAANIFNYGGINEGDDGTDVFYSPEGSNKADEYYINYNGTEGFCADDFFDEEDWDEGWEADEDDESEDEDYYDRFEKDYSEQINTKYMELFGKNKEYFEEFFDCSASKKKLIDSKFRVANFFPDAMKYTDNGVNDIRNPESTERIEYLNVGDRLDCVLEDGEIKLYSDKGLIGSSRLGYNAVYAFDILENKMEGIYEIKDGKKYIPDIIVTVNTVKPVSQRSKNAKYGVLTVDTEFSERINEYIKKLRDEQNDIKNNISEDCGDCPALKRYTDMVFDLAGFTFDGGLCVRDAEFLEKPEQVMSKEKRLENFFNAVPVYHTENTKGFIEVIVEENAKDEFMNETFGVGTGDLRKITRSANADGSVLFAKYYTKKDKKKKDKVLENALKNIRMISKFFDKNRVYGIFGFDGSTKYFYSEKDSTACCIADSPEKLRNGGGEALPVYEDSVTLGDYSEDILFWNDSERGAWTIYDMH